MTFVISMKCGQRHETMKHVDTLMPEYVFGTVLKWPPLLPLLTINLTGKLIGVEISL